MSDEQYRVTKDLAFAAYARMKRLKLMSAKRVGGSGFEFTFEDPEDLWKQFKIDYANSEAAEFDASCRHLKKLLNA
jgi:hypothetical protein